MNRNTISRVWGFLYLSLSLIPLGGCHAGRTIPIHESSSGSPQSTGDSEPITTTEEVTGSASRTSSSGSESSTSDSAGSTTTSTGPSVDSTSSTGDTDSGQYPLECGTAPILEYSCDSAGPGELAAKVQCDLTVPPDSSDVVAIDMAQCGDATIAAAGLVVELVLEDSKFCTTDFTISCPSGPPFPLISQAACGACDAGNYMIVFRFTGPSNVCTCKPGETCSAYYENESLCEYLVACDFASGDPWVLGITTHAEPLTIASVALRFVFEQ